MTRAYGGQAAARASGRLAARILVAARVFGRFPTRVLSWFPTRVFGLAVAALVTGLPAGIVARAVARSRAEHLAAKPIDLVLAARCDDQFCEGGAIEGIAVVGLLARTVGSAQPDH